MEAPVLYIDSSQRALALQHKSVTAVALLQWVMAVDSYKFGIELASGTPMAHVPVSTDMSPVLKQCHRLLPCPLWVMPSLVLGNCVTDGRGNLPCPVCPF